MTRSQAEAARIDVGLREYMLRVYNFMVLGLGLTGLVAYFSASTPAILNLLYAAGPDGRVGPTMLFWVVAVAPLGMVFFLSARIHSMRASTAQALYWIYAGLVGLSLAHIFLAFTGASVARVFFITAGAFAGLSLYGYTTKRDLSGFGSFLMMGLIGIILASVVNIFLGFEQLNFIISVIGVLVFSGLTAYDTQNIKLMYLESDTADVHTKKAILGALRLYLDFLNLFLMLLQLLGVARSSE
jgi:FtsH-binding integral membrane protein